MLKALIFDFDGTILDTETPEYEAWQGLFHLHGAHLSIDAWSRAVGTHDAFDPLQELEEQLGRPLDRAAALHWWECRHAELMARETIRPGVMSLLTEARASGVRLAVASSSHRDWVEPHLERLGIRAYFEAICTADDVEVVKPDPSLYLLALRLLKVKQEEAIAIEDSPNGVEAAQRAGLRCVLVPNAVTQRFVLPAADLRVDSLEEVTLARLQRLCSHGAGSDPGSHRGNRGRT